ncbi:histidinol-phosphatase [Microvirga sp. W0021]|uniref:Histidinol-phosphatase n=1 Tax=Hohaiivirga grylli TaxID=3133970 RepID=A0ABV0BJJ8_9HYPH
MPQPDFLPFIHKLASASGEEILPFFRNHVQAENKASGNAFDPVTEGDRAGEVVMRDMITKAYPEHGIIGEEFGISNPDSDYIWVLDPIDGTRSFIAGVPTWGTLVGLLHKGKPVAGMMAQAFTGERFYGDGHSAFSKNNYGTKPLKTRECTSLGHATLFTTDPRMFKGREREAYLSIENQVQLARFSADCYAYCMVAGGFADLVIETELKPHDIVALIPIIEGAGGIISSWTGGPATEGGNIIAAGDKRIHEEALKLFA